MKRLGLRLLVAMIAVVLAAGAGEAVLRLRGHRPWARQPAAVTVEPGGSFYAPHPGRGYSHRPGFFTVTLADGYSFHVTHGADTLRLTHQPSPLLESGSRPGIWIFGCSYTHGWSLNDEETYPWLVQQQLPDFEVTNFGVGGYGTYQSLLQLQEALEQRAPPRRVVFAYASFHDRRNTLTRSQRKTMVLHGAFPSTTYPHVRLASDGELTRQVGSLAYRPWPLMQSSALVHLLERSYNRWEEQALESEKATRGLLDQAAALARGHQSSLLLVVMTRDQRSNDVLEWARHRGIATVDIAVQLTPSLRNLPHDPHPGPAANRLYAAKLVTYLQADLDPRPRGQSARDGGPSSRVVPTLEPEEMVWGARGLVVKGRRSGSCTPA